MKTHDELNAVFKQCLHSFIEKDLEYGVVLNEADMKCRLYNRLFKISDFSKRSKESRGEEGKFAVNLVHSEYYRYQTAGSRKGERGRWDVAILYPESYPEPSITREDKVAWGNRDYHNRRPVMIGCELKFKYYRDTDREWDVTKQELTDDASVFSGRYAPEFGYVVHFEIVRTKEDASNHTLKNEKNLSKKRAQIKSLLHALKKHHRNIHLYFLQYNEDTEEFLPMISI